MDMLYSELFPLGSDTTDYRKITSDYVSKDKRGSSSFIRVEPEALTYLAETAQAI